MRVELHWSRQWADVVGGDGHLITDLVGRVIPFLTTDDAEALRKAETPETRRAADGSNKPWEVADAHGLRAALACAHQSAGRAVDTIAPYDPLNPHGPWIRWQPARRAAVGVCAALVLRRVADPELVNVLSRVWCSARGPLPEWIDTDTEPPDTVVRVVSEAEAARMVRHARAGLEFSTRQAREDAAAARTALTGHMARNVSKDAIRDLIVEALDEAGIAGKARRMFEARLATGPRSRLDTEPPVPADLALFDVGPAT